MTLNRLLLERVNRRDFLRKGTKGLLIGYGSLHTVNLFGNILEEKLSVSPQDAEAMGCAPILKETRRDVINQEWKTNLIVPIPKEGCYVGGYNPSGSVQDYALNLGKTPAFWDISLSKYGTVNEEFPKYAFEHLIEKGIVPEIKYGMVPFTGFKDIAKGGKDDLVSKFAEKAADFGKPYMFIPFKEPNIKEGVYWPHAGQPAGWFTETWRRMYDIFEKEGANKNTIWALNYVGTQDPAARQNLDSFYPGDDVVHWIGFAVANRVKLGQPYRDFRHIFSADYNWARTKHKKIPLALFEMVQSENPKQHKWIRQAYRDVKELFPAVKMVQWYEGVMVNWPWVDRQFFSTNHESVEAMQEVHSDPYFIGAPLQSLEKYKK